MSGGNPAVNSRGEVEPGAQKMQGQEGSMRCLYTRACMGVCMCTGVEGSVYNSVQELKHEGFGSMSSAPRPHRGDSVTWWSHWLVGRNGREEGNPETGDWSYEERRLGAEMLAHIPTNVTHGDLRQLLTRRAGRRRDVAALQRAQG